jgi:hypothetical protein
MVEKKRLPHYFIWEFGDVFANITGPMLVEDYCTTNASLSKLIKQYLTADKLLQIKERLPAIRAELMLKNADNAELTFERICTAIESLEAHLAAQHSWPFGQALASIVGGYIVHEYRSTSKRLMQIAREKLNDDQLKELRAHLPAIRAELALIHKSDWEEIYALVIEILSTLEYIKTLKAQNQSELLGTGKIADID